MSERTVRVRVPATSANLGPGFDAFGIACTLYNETTLTLTRAPGVEITARGEGASHIPADERNIVWKSVRYLLERAGCNDEFRGAKIHMNNRIPLSRGLGSSATAIVAGLKAANAILDNRFNRHELLQFATDMEGHPDNVAPAIYGGFTVNTVTNGVVDCFSFLPRIFMRFVIMVPNFYLSTKSARQVLPVEILMKDAIFNISHAGMMVAALARGAEKFLDHAFEDALHQNYRAELIPGMFDVFAAAKRAGAYGAALSGAGPCLIAFVPERRRCTDAVADAMRSAFRDHGVQARPLFLRLDTKGARIVNDRSAN
ncbi:homoserine kinase [Selenomonas sp. FOBRC9]|uniref:homoserine kinase n=1 Tax=Selenomonas sp. FOBRC9 TaxID=936573 RepID=UPI00027A570D|nr:homoserine kinase [Selenomonas sp. FOBRC9]EJP33411.1 homoserine kinase [Selenomonas sp. FOBRC9]